MDPDYELVANAIAKREPVTVHVLFGDDEGGQRVISRFGMIPISDAGWLCQVSRHWHIDNDDPR